MYQKYKIFFISHTKYQLSNILIWNRQMLGYCNKVFYCQTDDKKEYRIRIAKNNDFINRDNEYEVMNLLNINFIYYDKKTSNTIETWVPGEQWKKEFFQPEYIKKFIEKVELIHKINYSNTKKIVQHENLLCFELLKKEFKFEIIDKFIKLNNFYSKEYKPVLSHNDLSPSNIIFNKEKKDIHIIDFEWARINNPYWDYGNFIREMQLNESEIQILNSLLPKPNLQALIDNWFISMIFAFQWTFYFPLNNALFGYRERIYYFLNKMYYKFYNDHKK